MSATASDPASRAEPSPGDRARVDDLLERFGTNPASFFLRYEAPWRYFVTEEGAVAYLEVRRTAVAWTDPLCAPADLPAILARFTQAMRSRRLAVCFVLVQEATARAAMDLGYAVLKVGEEPAFDLPAWRPPRGDPGKKLRWCLNRARRASVVVEEYRPAEGRDVVVEAELAEVNEAWEAVLGRHGRAVVRSFLRASPLERAEDKRLFLAREGGRLVASLACTPVYGRDGWLLEDLARRPDAPTGATELLVVEAVAAVSAAGARFATIGVAPLRGAERQIDRRARWFARALRFAFDRFDASYHFASLSRYKSKFKPSRWEARFVAVNPPRPSVRVARAALSVLDPPPAPRPPDAERAGRRLVAAQAIVWSVASVVAIAGDRLSTRWAPAAGAVAPVGVVGVVVSVLLIRAALRLGRTDGLLDRMLVVLLEGLLVLGAVARVHHGRAPGFEITSALVASTVLVLLLRPQRARARD